MVPSQGQGVTMVGVTASGIGDRLSLLQGQTAEVEMLRKGKGCPDVELAHCGFGTQKRWFPTGPV